MGLFKIELFKIDHSKLRDLIRWKSISNRDFVIERLPAKAYHRGVVYHCTIPAGILPAQPNRCESRHRHQVHIAIV